MHLNFILKKKGKKINIKYDKTFFYFDGPVGSIKMPLNALHLSYLNNNLFLNRKYLKSFVSLLKKSFISVSSGWFLFISIEGIGYKMFFIDDKVVFDFGYSNLINLKPSDDISFYNFKNRILLFGIDYQKITNLFKILQKFSAVDVYKGKGIFLENSPIKLKQNKALQK